MGGFSPSGFNLRLVGFFSIESDSSLILSGKVIPDKENGKERDSFEDF
jgi:hypothetical protein